MVCMVVGGGGVVDHAPTLTVEPDFKSSGDVRQSLLTIGEVARRARVTTSTIRYYERRGLLAADARTSGQRRYRDATLRRLVFIGMLQDAGLALDDIDGILNAADVGEWKAIATNVFAWFLGRNDLSIALVDPETGSCRDGLHPDRANENRGGESVVSYLLGLADIRQLARVNVSVTPPVALRAIGA